MGLCWKLVNKDTSLLILPNTGGERSPRQDKMQTYEGQKQQVLGLEMNAGRKPQDAIL